MILIRLFHIDIKCAVFLYPLCIFNGRQSELRNRGTVFICEKKGYYSLYNSFSLAPFFVCQIIWSRVFMIACFQGKACLFVCLVGYCLLNVSHTHSLPGKQKSCFGPSLKIFVIIFA